MTINRIFSGASARVREQQATDRRILNLAMVSAGYQANIRKAIAEFNAEEIKTWNLQVSLFAIACLSVIYLAVSTLN